MTLIDNIEKVICFNISKNELLISEVTESLFSSRKGSLSNNDLVDTNVVV
jgi:hypothetical protein